MVVHFTQEWRGSSRHVPGYCSIEGTGVAMRVQEVVKLERVPSVTVIVSISHNKNKSKKKNKCINSQVNEWLDRKCLDGRS